MSDNSANPASLIASSAFIIIIGTIAGFILQFLLRTIPARLLGPDGYGLLILGFSVVSTVSIIPLLGLTAGLSRYLPRAENEQEKSDFILSCILIAIPASIIFSFVIYFGSNLISNQIFSEPSLNPILSLFSIMIPFLVIIRLSVSIFRGYKNSVNKIIVDDVFTNLFPLILILVLILIGYDVLGAAIGWLIGLIAVSFYSVFLVINISNVQLTTFNPKFRKLLVFSLPLLISSVMWQALQQMDNILIGYFLNSADVGIYDVAFTLSLTTKIALSGFAFLYLPIISEIHSISDGSNTKINNIYKTITRWVAIATVPVLIALLAYPTLILNILFGSEYLMSEFPLMILSIGFFTGSVFGLTINTLTALGDTKIIMIGNVIAAALNFLLNILLIPSTGILGAAIASATSYTILKLIYVYWLKRSHNINAFPKDIWFVITPTIIFSLLISQFLGENILSLVIIVSGSFVFGILTYLLAYGIDKNDKEILHMIKKGIGDIV